MGVVTRIADVGARALARLLSQFVGKSNIQKLVELFTDELQELEDTLYDLHTKVLDIDGAEGVQLDLIGRIVGETRGTSANDAEYRLRLRAWISARLAKGRVEGIYYAFSSLLASTQTAKAGAQWNASIEYQIIGTATTATVASVLLRILRRAVGADQHATLVWSEHAEADTFVSAAASPTIRTQVGTTSAGATFTDHAGTVGFPASGVLVFEPGTGSQETIRYSSFDGTNFYFVGTVKISHAALSVVALGTAVGKGFCVATHLTNDTAPTDTIIDVTSTSTFPTTGTLVLSQGQPEEETITYTGKTALTFTGCAGIAEVHVSGNEVFGGVNAGRLAAMGQAA